MCIVYDLTTLLEATLGNLARKQKSIVRLFPTFQDRVKNVGLRGGVRLDSWDDDTWNFKVHSGTEMSLWYDDMLQFLNVEEVLAELVGNVRLWNKTKTKINLSKLGRAFMKKVQVKISCSCLTGDTMIPLLDGRVLPLTEVLEEYGNQEFFWVYSSDENGDLVPGKAWNLGETKKTNTLYCVTLDNGKTIRCTADHLFRMRDGSYVRADQLKARDSLLPLYQKETKLNSKFSQSYEKVKLNSKLDSMGRPIWKTVHRIVSETLLSAERQQKAVEIEDTDDWFLVVHHKDGNTKNNTPENLEWLGNVEHWHRHSDFDKTSLIAAIKRCWEDPDFRKEHTEKNRNAGKICFEKYPDVYAEGRKLGVAFMQSAEGKALFSKLATEQWAARSAEERKAVGKKISAGFSEESRKKASERLKKYWTPEHKNQQAERMRQFWIEERRALQSKKLKGSSANKAQFSKHVHNHKVVSIVVETQEVDEPVYDIYVEKHHNFALAAGVFVHNCPAQLYYGGDYIISLPKYDAKYGEPETRPPREKNPKKYGAYCKHLQAVMKVLPFHADKIAKWIKQYHMDIIDAAEMETRKAMSLKKDQQAAARTARAAARRAEKSAAKQALETPAEEPVPEEE